MQGTIFILVLLLGLALGSFLNVVIHRLPMGLSLARPGSQCPACHRSIRAYDNIPIVSYLLLRGRCRFCRSTISLRYPLVESLTALLLLLLYAKFGLTPRFLAYGTLVGFLIPIAFIDWDTGLILDKLTVPCFILGIGFVFGFHFVGWKSALFGAVAGGALPWFLGWALTKSIKKDSLGFGDVKLLVMAGVYIGFPAIWIALFFSALSASLYVALGLLLRKIRLSDKVKFGPFIALGIVLYILMGPSIAKWYWDSF